jgi:hypothetical protein
MILAWCVCLVWINEWATGSRSGYTVGQDGSGFMSVGLFLWCFRVNQLWLMALNGRVGMVFIGFHTAVATSACATVELP